MKTLVIRFLVVALWGCGTAAFSDSLIEVLPDHSRDSQIKNPDEFFGFAIGSRHLRHHQLLAYFSYLDKASARVLVESYATSHGGRELFVAYLSSEANLLRSKQLAARRQRLVQGTTVEDLSQELLVMQMGYTVHGNEASGLNAAPWVAYHLASSQDPAIESQLKSSMILIDPCLNPDGADRFANWSNENRGRFASPLSIDREHREGWPGGRTNYYWFDLNRDWLPVVHPESRGRLRLFRRWRPNVVLDFHEMGGSSSYFFQPGIPERNNPFTDARNFELTKLFAIEHAKILDAADELYFTEERFDDFYMGKGSTYPDLHGSVGILFEQGSTRGLKLVNDRTSRTFADTVANQIRTSLSSLKAAGMYREQLLRFQNDFYSESLAAGSRAEVTAYILHGSTSRIAAAKQLLDIHGIQSVRPQDVLRVGGQEIDSDKALVIPTAQPEYNFVKSLMEPLQSFKQNIFYDVSTWHLPSAFDLDCIVYDSEISPRWLATSESSAQAEQSPPLAVDVSGYAVSPVELSAPRLVAALQRRGATVRVSTRTVRLSDAGAELPLGSFFLLKQPNEKNWPKLVGALGQLGNNFGIKPVEIRSGLTAVGPDLGSGYLLQLAKCSPLLMVGEGTDAYDAGSLWHFLEHRMQQPVTLVDCASIADIDFHEAGISCVIMPSGSYAAWAEHEVDAIKEYLKQGGTLVVVGKAIKRAQSLGLIQNTTSERSAEESTSEAKRWSGFGEAETNAALERIAGAFFMAEVDVTHPLAYGFPDRFVPVFRNHTESFSIPLNSYQVAARYKRVEAGYVSQKNSSKLSGTAAVWVQRVGSGRVIAIADPPVFRGYNRGSERFLTNAILLGPSLSVPSAADDESSHGHGHGH